MSKPKKHHYVPQFLLRSFVDDEGWLHWARVNQREPTVRRTRPDGLFHQNNLYSMASAAGEMDPAVELDLSELETAASPIVREIIECARADRVPSLDLNARRVWYSFFATQWRRTPETRESVVSEETTSAMLEDIIVAAKKRFPHRSEEIDTIYTPEKRALTVRNAWATTLPQTRGKVEAVLEKRGMTILRIVQPNKSFIIGSRPVAKLTPKGRTDMRDPIVEMWLPVAADVAVGAGDGDGGIRLLYLENPAPVRQLNLAIASQSSTIAGRSPLLVRSIATRR